MKRLLLLSVLSLMALFVYSSVALAAGSASSSTSSSVSPTRYKSRPFKFRTSGSVRIPRSLCAPQTAGGDCLPLRCPAGVSNASYCSPPTAGEICTGRVTITFKKGTRSVASRQVQLRTDCTYSAGLRITKKGKYKVRVTFAGNTVLAASRASTKSVRAG